MIESFNIKNFKSLKEMTLSARALNILAGLNGMGKSSFLQTLLLLKQSAGIAGDGRLQLKGWLIDIGKGKDALYQFAAEETIELSLMLGDGKILKWTFNYEPEWEFLESNERYPDETLDGLLDGFQYLSAERIGPVTMHDASQLSVSEKNLGVKGEYTVHFLHVNGNRRKVDDQLKHDGTEEPTLMNQVNGWLNEISPGIKLKVVELPGIDKMLLNYQFDLGAGKTAPFQPANVGFGVSYALSVIVSLLTSEKENIIIIENPEAHIHPRGQAALGKLMALAAARGAQLFIETHSDHIINGIRVAVKEGLIDNNDVSFSYFTKATTRDEQYTEVTEIKVDQHGELSAYPMDFLDEWNNQLLKLV